MKRKWLPVAASVLLLAPWARMPASAQTKYPYGPDSQVQESVPKGEVSYFKFASSRIYPGTERDCWVYVPKQYDGTKPACVLVFNDGGWYQDRNGQWRTPTVLDNLIAKGEMPVTIAVFVNPGVVPSANPNALPRYNRSVEYDSVDDTYARFLTQELLPEVGKKYRLTSDPNGRAICGASSGGIASFTAAWTRPDLFRRVVSFIGSFTDLRGGHTYPTWIRKSEPKPIRVFLQEGSNDQDIYSGSWFIGNNDVAAALKFAGYAVEYVVGDGGHNGEHGAAVLPDALRFAWKGYPAPVVATPSGRQPISSVVEPGETWTAIPLGGEALAGGNLAADPAGNVYVNDGEEKTLYRVAPDGKVTVLSDRIKGRIGAFGPDGKLYVIRSREVVAVGMDGKEGEKRRIEVVSLAFAHDGTMYGLTEDGSVLSGKWAETFRQGVGEHPRSPTLLLSPDQSLLFVAPPPEEGKYVLSYRITAAGVGDGQRYHDLATVYGHSAPFAHGMAADTDGWLYVATEAGVQMLDQAGRVNGILLPPPGIPRGLTFGGPGKNYLYVTAGGKLYRRKMRATGVLSCEPPIKPPGPRL
ncbi:MAG: alpha/beta hydrolase-fold protein [Capsulimonadales bacterium]|nr:alpha/beta hydrolase-fold protein [Capsulimonadales bacterium]